jgi:type II secretory pathway pseudopilin PulG
MFKQRGIFGLSMIPMIIIGIVLAAAAGWLYNQNRKIKNAELARDQAIVQRDQTAVERDKAISVARENERTVLALQEEQKLINKALNDLAAAKTEIQERTVTREVVIQGQAGTASSTAVTAPVIAATISSVQDDRIRRRGGTPSITTGPAPTNGAPPILE